MSLVDDPKDLQHSNIRRRSRASFQWKWANEKMRYTDNTEYIKYVVPKGSMKREPNLSLKYYIVYTSYVKYFLHMIRTIIL